MAYFKYMCFKIQHFSVIQNPLLIFTLLLMFVTQNIKPKPNMYLVKLNLHINRGKAFNRHGYSHHFS
jgi:hypothetical protein